MDKAQISQGLHDKVCSMTQPNSFAFVLLFPLFGISTIIHHKLIAMLQGHMKFVYSERNDSSKISDSDRAIVLTSLSSVC